LETSEPLKACNGIAYLAVHYCEPGSLVGTATDYGLDGPGIEYRINDTLSLTEIKRKIPVGARFFAHVQTGPGAHAASCTMGTGSITRVKRPKRDADHTTTF
jgi:hypothetical protein